MTIALTKNTFVASGAQSIAFNQFLSITSDASNPTYLIVSGLDRDEYTATSTGKSGTLTGNGATANFTAQAQGDQREVGIVFTWDAASRTYKNATYGSLMDLKYNTSASPNDLTALTFFGTNNLANTVQYTNNTLAATPSVWKDYGTATFATQSVGKASVTQATPNSICSTAMQFVGDVWNVTGCWVLANTIATEAGAALPLTSNYLTIPGVSNSEWKVAYNGPVTPAANWATTVRAGDVVAFMGFLSGLGHITTVVSGQGSSAMVVDNVGSPANDGSSQDLYVETPHAASDEFGAMPSTVVVYRLDTPTVTAAMANETVTYGTRQSLSSLFSASDWAGTGITRYQVYLSSGSDTLIVNGAASTLLTSAANAADVASLANVFLLTGNTSHTDTLQVRARNADGYWGDWSSGLVSVVNAANLSAPVLAHQTATQSWTTGHTLSFALPATSFADANGSVLSYTATQADGKKLPSWLTIDPSTGTLRGSVPTVPQILKLVITATDIYGKAASDSFTANIVAPMAPVAATPINTQTALFGKLFALTVPAGAFTDPQGEVPTYTFTQADGSALPDWLTFYRSTDAVYNPASAMLYSSAAPTTPTTVNIKLTATNTDGLATSETFQIVDRAPQAPLLAKQTPAQTAYIGHAFSFTIPDGNFLDQNGSVTNNSTLNYRATLADGTALPSWLSFDDGWGRFWGTAPATATTMTIKITAFDGGSLSASNTIIPALTASETFVINVDPGAPVVLYQMPTVTMQPGYTTNFSLAGAFSDPQGGLLTYTATLADGSALPTWLTFDPTTAAFSGKRSDPAPNIKVKITAANTAGSASETFAISDAPIAIAQVPDQSVYSGHSMSFSVANTFADPLGEALTYSCQAALNSQNFLPSLPAWLTFNPATDTFTAVAPAVAQPFIIVLTATNSDGASLSQSFTITDRGLDTPKLTAQTPAQFILGGHKLSFSAASAFSDPLKETLTYKIISTTGTALPSWLTFNPATATFAGTAPSGAQTVAVLLTATNTDGGSASETITIVDQGLDTPKLSAPTAAQSVLGGHVQTFSIADAFVDPGNETLSYKAVLTGGAALPSWLKLNAATGIFSGTADAIARAYALIVTATNTDGQSVTETVTVTNNGLDRPTLKTQVAAQSTWSGQAFSVSAANAFADPFKETLIYKATQTSGQPLPSWLSFDALTQTFSGTTPKAASTTNIMLTATNTDGQSAVQTFAWTNKADTINVATHTPNQTWNCGQAVNFVVPAGTFIDAEGQSLTYAATQANGAALPAGLSFDSANDRFSGTAPITPQTLNLKVTATDTDGVSSSETFAVFIAAAAPTVSAATANQILVDGQKLNLPLSSAFSDPQRSVLKYTATEIIGPNATGWLHLSNGVLTGTLPTTGSAALGIRVTATNQYGMSATETFGLAYAPSGSTAPTALYTNASPATELLALHA